MNTFDRKDFQTVSYDNKSNERNSFTHRLRIFIFQKKKEKRKKEKERVRLATYDEEECN